MGFWRDKKRLGRALDRAGVRYALRPEGMRLVVDLHPHETNLARAAPALAEWPELAAWAAASPRPAHVETATMTMTAALAPATDEERDEEAALLAAIIEHPDDDGPRLVYADRLIARGDPLGELIVMQCSRDATAARRADDVLARSWQGLAPEVADFATHAPGSGGYSFVRGFVDRAIMTVDDFVAHGERVFGAYPTQTLELKDWLPNCALLATVPALARVRRIVMRPNWHVNLSTLARGAFDKLEHFDCHLMNSTRHDRSQDDEAFFAELHAPRLASIDLGYNKSPASVRGLAANDHLPRLRAYKEHAGFPWHVEDLAPAYARLAERRALEALTLSHSTPGLGDDGVIPFFAHDAACALRVLSLSKTGVTDRLLHAIARSPKARLLESVRLLEDAITVDGLRALVEAAPALRELAASTPDPAVAAYVRSRQTSGG